MGELLVLLVIGVVLWLLNVVLPTWMQRQQRDTAREVGPPVPPVALRPRPPQLAREVARHGLRPPAVEPLVAVRQRVPMRLGSRRDIRRGVILMTILGPCRALEPADPAR
jgi:hypothetical protein